MRFKFDLDLPELYNLLHVESDALKAKYPYNRLSKPKLEFTKKKIKIMAMITDKNTKGGGSNKIHIYY